ncbi:FAD-binding protein [Microbacterium aurum]
MVEARTRDELIDALREIWAAGDPWLVIGGGSNLLVGDEPFEGTVVLVRTRGIERLPGAGRGPGAPAGRGRTRLGRPRRLRRRRRPRRASRR